MGDLREHSGADFQDYFSVRQRGKYGSGIIGGVTALTLEPRRYESRKAMRKAA